MKTINNLPEILTVHKKKKTMQKCILLLFLHSKISLK